jgi:hypothetical protein
MTNAEQRIVHLEQLIKNLLDTIARMQAAIAALQQGQRTGQASPYSGGGGGGIFIMAGAVIAAGGTATNVTVDYVIAGAGVVATTTGTVYNMMQSATVSGKTIVLGSNPDGTFTVITQSC